MISIDPVIKGNKNSTHLREHARPKQRWIVNGQARVVRNLRNIDATQSSKLRGIGQPEKIKNPIPPQLSVH